MPASGRGTLFGTSSTPPAAWLLNLLRHRRWFGYRSRGGINVGDIIADGEDMFGEGVNIAVRLEGIAEPGTSWNIRSTGRVVRKRTIEQGRLAHACRWRNCHHEGWGVRGFLGETVSAQPQGVETRQPSCSVHV